MQAGKNNNNTSLKGPVTTESTILKNNSVLILSQFYWPEQIGTPLYVTDFSEWMAEKANEVTVVTGRPYYPDNLIKAGYEHGQRDAETKNGVAILRLPTYVPRGGKALKRIASELFFLLGVLSRVIFRRIKRRSLVVSFSPSIATVLGGIFCTVPGGRHLAVIHDIQSGLAVSLGLVGSGFVHCILRYFEKFVLNRVNAIIVLTPHMKLILQEQGINTPITVIPLWVDLDEFEFTKTNQKETSIVQYSGNLGRKQGMEQVLDLAEILLKKRPEIRIIVRGGGSQVDFVRREIKKRGLINTELSPLLPRDQLPEALSEADIHLVPQNPKTADFAVPSKIYPIMATGRPIVATASPDTALYDLQKKTDGAITCVPPNDPLALASAVISLIDDKNSREKFGRNGRSYIETTSRREHVLSQYGSLLVGLDNYYASD